MQAASKDKLTELQTIISRMPLNICCTMVAPEFGVRWREVSKAIRNTRLPMASASVARVLTRHAAKSLMQDEVDIILQRLRLKSTRVSAGQHETLMDFVDLHPEVAKGFASTPESRKRSVEMWSELVLLLNAHGDGVSMNSSQWAKYYYDFEFKTKKNDGAINRYRIGTGGGPPSTEKLTDVESGVIDFMGTIYGQGLDGVMADPIPSPHIMVVSDEEEEARPTLDFVNLGASCSSAPDMLSSYSTASPSVLSDCTPPLPKIRKPGMMKLKRLKPAMPNTSVTVVQERKWHIIDLLEPTVEYAVDQIIQDLPERVSQAVRQIKKGKFRPEVHTLLLNDLLYMSVSVLTERGSGPVLYVCAPPGANVAAVSSLTSTLLPACVLGLGYRKHEDAKLYGKDIHSLLRIHNKGWTANAEYLDEIPPYNPIPTITTTGIDYTYKTYNLNYVDMILGPEPPILTELTIESTKAFFDPSRLNKVMNVKIQIKSQDIANTLKSWVNIGALHPTSELFMIFTKVKGNRLQLDDEEIE